MSADAAMYVNELGTGETLLFPFYTAGMACTLVNIANATNDHKVVRVRMIEARNSQVLDNLASPQTYFAISGRPRV